MAPPRKNKLPKPLPEGFVLTDTEQKKWKLGKIIGQGGFGLIYLASQDVDRPVAGDTDFVIKVEYQANGPLFSELKFYQRAAKLESMQKWKRSRKLDFLGIPSYWGSGLAEHNDLSYRFMAMDRLGSDLQKVCGRNGGRLKKATVLQLGHRLVDVLEYIHENEYVHADVKAANLMLGYRDPEQVYLADYGLSYRYCPDGVHKEYKENPKKGHNGTIEYTSLDAHKGLTPSRRSDLQILGFCLVHWLCGSLPWDDVLKNPTQVQEAKTRLMDNLPDSVQQLSVSGASTDELGSFLLYVKTLDYQDKPDYKHLKDLLPCAASSRLDFSVPNTGPSVPNTGPSVPNTGPSVPNTGPSGTEDPRAREKKAGRARGPPKAKRPPAEVDDGARTKTRQAAARYRRGSPLMKPPSQLKEDVVPPVRRSQSPRPNPVYTSNEDSKTEEEDVTETEDEVVTETEDEDVTETEDEDVRPKRIPACYLRGPPMKPGAQPKQKTNSKRRTDDPTATSRRPEQRHRLQRRNHLLENYNIKSQTRIDNPERRDEGPRHHHPQRCYQHRDHSGEQEESVLKGPGWEAASIQRHRWTSWLVFLGVVLLMAAVHAVFQNPFKSL